VQEDEEEAGSQKLQVLAGADTFAESDDDEEDGSDFDESRGDEDGGRDNEGSQSDDGRQTMEFEQALRATRKREKVAREMPPPEEVRSWLAARPLLLDLSADGDG